MVDTWVKEELAARENPTPLVTTEIICIVCKQPKGFVTADQRRSFGLVKDPSGPMKVAFAHADRLSSPSKGMSCVSYWNGVVLKKSAKEHARELGAEALANREAKIQQREKEEAAEEFTVGQRLESEGMPARRKARAIAEASEARQQRAVDRKMKAPEVADDTAA